MIRSAWVRLDPYLERYEVRSPRRRVVRYPGLSVNDLHHHAFGTRSALYADMRKTTRRRNRRQVTDRSTTTDVVSQLECAIKNPHAALIGAVIGGLVPWFGRTLAHGEIPDAWASGRNTLALGMLAVVLGCAAFSAISVYKFGKAAFGDSNKAIGFTLALEGVMLVSHGATSNMALAVLIVINAVANGAVIALAREATNKRREADARRVATRSRNRSAGAPVRPAAAIVVEEAPATAPAARRPRPVKSHALITTPRWMPSDADDTVIDAEIISESELLS